METTSTHPLSEGDCWNLFKGIAFKDGLEVADPELVEIGRDIVNKCAGDSLAVKTLGGLCYRSNKQMWEFVRDSHIWKLSEEHNGGILCALKISYFHLPFYVKQCFAYCSLFPKGYKIQKDMLIQLWIAQELIHPFEENQSLSDIGSEYIEVLMKISFFQEPEVDYCGKVIEFKMHDLVHDLAQSVSGVECFTVCKDKEENYHEGIRHLFFNIEVPRSPFETSGVIAKPSNIQTLIFALNINFSLEIICSSFKLLRVLKFRNDEMVQLPDSIDRLKHLRYLQIQCSKIKNLPESITNLQNLQVLKLECERLERLPTKIQNMISLKHIILIPLINLSHMPCELEELHSLERLSHFVVSKGNVGCALNGLNELTNLGGELEIWNLERVENAEEIKETILKEKKNLSELKLVWDECEYPVKDRLRFWRRTRRSKVGLDLKVLEKLEPHPNLKKLEIKGYGDVRFPRWMMECWLSLRNVVSVTIEGCKNCEHLTCFSRLPSLKILKLESMDNLKYIEDRSDLQSGKECFSMLTTLEVRDCPKLESWFPAVEAQHLLISFPSLVHLNIWRCPNLKSVPIEVVGVSNSTNSPLFPSLEKVSITGYERMESWPNWLVGSHLPSLRDLEIGYVRSPRFLPQHRDPPPSSVVMVDISIYWEEALPEWMANITSSFLQKISLIDCLNLKILPEWVLRDNTTVRDLEIIGCPHLKLRYNKETGKDRHKIAHIENTNI